MRNIRRLEPKGPVWADDFNALAAQVDHLSKMTGDGADVDQTPGGPTIKVDPTFFGIWARVTNPDSTPGGPWAWRQVRPDLNGGFADMMDSEGPRHGTAVMDSLYHSDDSVTIADGDVAFIVKGVAHVDGATVQQDWLVLTGDGAPAAPDCTFTAVTAVCIDSAGRLHVERTTFRKNDCTIVSKACVIDPTDCCTPVVTPCGQCTSCGAAAYCLRFDNFTVVGINYGTVAIPVACSIATSGSVSFLGHMPPQIFGYPLSVRINCALGIGGCNQGLYLISDQYNCGSTASSFNGCTDSLFCDAQGNISAHFNQLYIDYPPCRVTYSGATLVSGACNQGGSPRINFPSALLPENAFGCGGCGG